MDKSEVGKGTIYLYVENVIAMFLGYAFWFILSKLTTPEIIGISSSLTSFAAIFASIASFGIPIGVQRLLGNMYFERKFEEIKVLVNASMLILSIGIIICSLLIFVTRNWLYSSVDLGLIIISIVLVASTDISVLFRYIIIASLKTKKLLAVSIYSSLGKLALAIILVLMGTGALGVMMGYVFTPILTSIFLAFTIITILKKSSNKPTIEFRVYFKKLFSASIASWIPLLIDTIGSQLGTIAVFGIQGVGHAGFYFIPFQICTGIFAVIWALESTTYPKLSSMENTERKNFSWRIIKIAMIIISPLSYSLIFYSYDIMHLFGNDYTEGSAALQILLISVLPTTVMAGISTFLYSYGNYRAVLIIGLATSIPRIMLYFLFVPPFGTSGAALSYTIGSFIGFTLSMIIAKRIEMLILWKDLALMTIVPIAIVLILRIANAPYVIGIFASIIISYIFFLKFQIIGRSEVQDSLGVLPESARKPIARMVNFIGKKLNRSF